MRQTLLLAFLLVASPGCEHTASVGETGPSGGELCRLPSEDDFRIENPVNASEELFNELLPSQLAALYEGVGQYANGDVPVYQGRLDAIEYESAIVGREDETIDATRALASLKYQENLDRAPTPLGYVLLLFAPEERKMMSLFQSGPDRSVTYASGVSPFYSSGGTGATCTNCLLDLASVESGFDVDLTARGTYGDFEMSEMRVDVHGELERIPTEELTLDDLLVVSSRYEFPVFLRLDPPRLEGSTHVFDVQGDVRTSTPVDAEGCEEIVSYDIEWYVRRDCLLDYGPRNLVRGEPRLRCPTGG
jgi:hypothetical protein